MLIETTDQSTNTKLFIIWYTSFPYNDFMTHTTNKLDDKIKMNLINLASDDAEYDRTFIYKKVSSYPFNWDKRKFTQGDKISLKDIQNKIFTENVDVVS